MIIDKLIIRSFKSIVDQEIDLGRVNVLVGANGSGKSNILEALGVLSAAASGRVDDESLMRRGVRPGVPRLYKSAFFSRIAPHIYFEVRSNNTKYSVSLNNPLEKPLPAWQFKTEELLFQNDKIISRGIRAKEGVKNEEQGLAALKMVELSEDNPAKHLIDLLREYAIFAPNTPTLRGLVTDQQTRKPVGLAGGGLAEAFRELNYFRFKNIIPKLNDIIKGLNNLIDWISYIGTTPIASSHVSSSVPQPKIVLRFWDRYMRSGKGTLSAYDASEGVLYVLLCLVLALHPSAPKCLAIDNLDQTLNPRLAWRLATAICDWLPHDRQIIFTAHNPAFLDGLPLDDDSVRLFTVDRNNQGHTQVNRVVITEELRSLSEEKGWPLSRLWMMGHLGGVPNV